MPPQQPHPGAPASPEVARSDDHGTAGGRSAETPLGSLWRARSYLRPYRWQLAFMLLAAVTAVAAEIIIPLLTKAMIDGAVTHHQRSLLLPIGAAAIGLGVVQAMLNFLRRWVQASAVAGLEQSMRDDIYAHLQRLQPSFHDDWQSGQLLSRATNDLSAIRRFAGFGIVFLITNTVTFVAVILLLIRLNWWLGLITATVFVPVLVVSTRFQRRYRVLSRRSQDQQGDLATYVEEAATGIRVLKALGRGGEAAGRHSEQAAEVYRTELGKARLRSTFWAGLDLIPNALIGVLLLLGAIATSRHELTLGGLVAFITLTLQLVWPIESMGYILAGGQEAATAAQRIYEILDTEPAIASPQAGAAGRPVLARPGPSAGEGGRAPVARGGAPEACPRRRRRFPGGSGGSPPRASTSGVRPGRVPVPGRGAGFTARRLAGRGAGPDGRADRHHRGRQDHPAAPGAPAGRCHLRGGAAGRHGRAAAAAAGAPVPGRLRVRGPHAVLGQRPGERELRRPGRR